MSRVPHPPRLRAAHLVVDVSDLERAVAFWSGLLDAQVSAADPGYCDLEPLGATPASDVFDRATTPWQVWRDPDGNEFCLSTEAVAGAASTVGADTARSPDAS
jgi:catechol 2,3-dioxygenase-like lactoylglutathione lyase family enzyme